MRGFCFSKAVRFLGLLAVLTLAAPMGALAKNKPAAQEAQSPPGFETVEVNKPAGKSAKAEAGKPQAAPAQPEPAKPAAIVTAPVAAEAAKPPESFTPERKLSHEPEDDEDQLLVNALNAGFKGPDKIALNDQASIVVPAGRVFIRAKDMKPIFDAYNMPQDPDTVGILMDDTLAPNYLIYVDWQKTGYVKDDEAKNWDVDKLLESYRRGAEDQNAEITRLGGSPIEIIGWVERPAYDAKQHRLVHAISARHKGAGADRPPFMNYSTYALGREGMFNIVLAADLSDLDKYRYLAQKTLSGVNFYKGKAYEDVDLSRDTIAPFTLAAVAGGLLAAKKFGGLAVGGKVAAGAVLAAKKFGLFKLIGLFFLKFWKFILLALAVVGAGLRKMFGGK